MVMKVETPQMRSVGIGPRVFPVNVFNMMEKRHSIVEDFVAVKPS